MKSKLVDNQPQEVTNYLEIDPKEQDAVECVNEIFNTPLKGTYNWDYTVVDDRIKKLYELGKKLNWNVSDDLDWSQTHPKDEFLVNQDFRLVPDEIKGINDLSMEERLAMDRHQVSWNLSQFLHGEQGALLVASQLVSCAPTFNAKMYAASQTFDEARHVESFNRYIQSRMELMYPIGNALKSILDKILTDPRWDLKFIGMQLIIEGLALAAFRTSRDLTPDPVLKDMLDLIIRDEARHVTFGINYLEEFVTTLSEKEIEERAQFAYEACFLSKERLVSIEVYEHFGWNVEDARQFQLSSEIMQTFQKLLFQRVMPNLKRIGLLTDSIRPKFEKLGILEYEDDASDADIDWADLSRPLFKETAELAP